jgi:hypothetical protein
MPKQRASLRQWAHADRRARAHGRGGYLPPSAWRPGMGRPVVTSEAQARAMFDAVVEWIEEGDAAPYLRRIEERSSGA